MQKAVFGGGCFWHIQYAFSKVPGVVRTTAGYMGGDEEKYRDVTYQEVCTGKTGYAEVVLVEFDSKKISYRKLLKIFWTEHDPTTINRQGLDVGTSYRSAIFYFNDLQKNEAEKSKNEAGKDFMRPIVTEISKARKFVKAEEYHQNYVEKNGGIDACYVRI